MWIFKKLRNKGNDKPVGSFRVRHKNKTHRYSASEKLEIIREYEKSKLSISRFCKNYGITDASLTGWLGRYKAHGEAGLKPAYRGKNKPLEPAVKDEIIRLKKENPVMGVKKMSDWLARNKFVMIGGQTILKILRENPETANLVAESTHRRARKHPAIQHFERSRPRQMYQMDIMTWMLRGMYRVYVITCLDDYSRFVVSFGLFRRARSSETLDVLKAAIETYGMPEEVLTDNGPQFYTWRGRSEFQKFLVRSGIQGVRSRPRHPQTLGKVESFWRNMYQEMLSRVPIATFEEAQQKIHEWVKYYNFQRPHQGIDGLVPADRFFGIEKPIREAMEKGAAMVKDSLVVNPKQLSEPMYLVGRVGGKEIKVIAKEGSIVVSGLEEVEKKDSPEAILGVKLTENTEAPYMQEGISYGRNETESGTDEIPQTDTGRGQDEKPAVILAKTEDSGADQPGAFDNRGGDLPVAPQEQEGIAQSTIVGEERQAPQ